MTPPSAVRARRTLVPALFAAALCAGVLIAEPASAEPNGTVLAAATGVAVQESYIVTLKDTPAVRSTAGAARVARELTSRHRGRLGAAYNSALRGFAVKLPAARARKLAGDRRVARVEQDSIVKAADVQSPATWGLDRIDQRKLPLSGTYGYTRTAANVSVYVIDTGIRISHADFGGRARTGPDYVPNDSNPQDCSGHGTHVAGTIGGSTYGVAKGVTLYSVRVLDCRGSGTLSGVMAGVEWVTRYARKPAVANMSLGAGASPSLDAAVRRSIASGVTYALAAGNSNRDACTTSPARVGEAITVGATTSTDTRAGYSNYGKCVSLFAPGSEITSDWYTGNADLNTISGTSMAAPHVAGAAALYLASRPTAKPAQVKQALLAAATAGIVKSAGTGSPNKLLFTETVATPAPAAGSVFENATDVTITDAGDPVTSSIAVTGVTGNAPMALKVKVLIKHGYRGDLVIDLIAPDGSSYRLKNSAGSDAADHVDTTYSVNGSAVVAAGTWTLQVTDVYRLDTGFLDKWSLQF